MRGGGMHWRGEEFKSPLDSQSKIQGLKLVEKLS